MFRRARSPWLINMSGKLAFRTFQTIFHSCSLFSLLQYSNTITFRMLFWLLLLLQVARYLFYRFTSLVEGRLQFVSGRKLLFSLPIWPLDGTLSLAIQQQLIFLQIVSKRPRGCLSLVWRGDWNCLISIIRLCLDNTWLCLLWAMAVVCIRMFGTHGP